MSELNNERDELVEIIGQAIGQASMQWEFPTKGGVYQSDEACKLLHETVAKILESYVCKEEAEKKYAEGFYAGLDMVKKDGYVRKEDIEICEKCKGDGGYFIPSEEETIYKSEKGMSMNPKECPKCKGKGFIIKPNRA